MTRRAAGHLSINPTQGRLHRLLAWRPQADNRQQQELFEFAGSDQMGGDIMLRDIGHRNDPEFGKMGKAFCRRGVSPVLRAVDERNLRPTMGPLVKREHVQLLGRYLQLCQPLFGDFTDAIAREPNQRFR